MSTPRSNPRTGPQRPKRDPQPIIYSICIPRVFKNIGEKRVRAIMYSLKFGFVERVDMVAKTNQKGDEFWRVFVHFSSWNERNDSAMQVQAKLDSGDQVKIVYDSPWYWMISKSKTQRPEQRQDRGGRPAPFIDFGHTADPSLPDTEDFPPTVRKPRSPPVRSQSPAYCPPSPDYLPHTPPPAQSWSDRAAPRSPSPEPAMPQRSMTSAPGGDDYQEELN
jgi:hypothetical protein